MDALNNKLVRAIELQNRNQLDEAARLFDQVLSLDANNGAALYSLAVIALHGGRLDEALRLAERGVTAAPSFAPLHFVHATVVQALGRKLDALKSYDEALRLEPNNISVLLNSGALLRELQRHREALERFNQILTVDADNPQALANCAIVLTEFKQSERAIAMFERLLHLQPDYDYGLGLLCYERLHICDWKDFESLSQLIVAGIRGHRRVCKTLAFMALSDSAEEQLAAAQTFAAHFCPRQPTSLWDGERYQHERIRIAYVSPDLREHPVGHLMAGVFECHDKSRFEIIAISLGTDDQSRLRARIHQACDQFIDVRLMGTAQIAEMMRDMEIDIAVDLAGYTSDSRAEIFAHRPAPVQVNYLGYSGTLGSDYMDYIIADRHVIPAEHQRYYSEKVIYLPDAYLPTDASLRVSPRMPSRTECGLPEQGFVFCSFSHDYKINPRLYDVWMRLLASVPGSVLWLTSRNETSQANLRKEAQQRGIDPERLVFAWRVPLIEDHLARYRQADLFLDTHPYGAHSTSADALMAGLPVVTCMGGVFAARVAGSLLNAVGLPELVTASLAEYEALALSLAVAPERLLGIRKRLSENIKTSPLFDTKGFCRNLEVAYMAMWRQSQLGNAHDALCAAD